VLLGPKKTTTTTPMKRMMAMTIKMFSTKVTYCAIVQCTADALDSVIRGR